MHLKFLNKISNKGFQKFNFLAHKKGISILKNFSPSEPIRGISESTEFSFNFNNIQYCQIQLIFKKIKNFRKVKFVFSRSPFPHIYLAYLEAIVKLSLVIYR